MSSGITLTKYSVYCHTESKYLETEYMLGIPTTCPNNNTHIIDTYPESIKIVDTYSTSSVITSDNMEGTNGVYEMRCKDLDIRTSVRTHDIIFYTPEVDTRVLLTQIFFSDANIGDRFSLIASPYTPVGVLTVNANIGDTVLSVNSTVVANTIPGLVIYIGNTNVELGRCVAVDKINNTITLLTPLTSAYTAGVYVKIGYSRVDNCYVYTNKKLQIGSRSQNVMLINKNLPLLLKYTNNDGAAKKFCIVYEFYY